MAIIQFIEGLNRTKIWRKKKYGERRNSTLLLAACLLELEHQFSPVLELEFTPSASVVLGPSDLIWNYTTNSPVFPAGRQHIMGLLSLYNHIC